MSVTVEGIGRAIADLLKIQAATAAAGKVAEERGAEEVLQAAKAKVPVATGRLSDSLRVRREADDVFVGTDVEYAAFVEFGTHDAPAQPFLRPAADSAKPAFDRQTAVLVFQAIRVGAGL
jgi:HK97 gp10 family phage protein